MLELLRSYPDCQKLERSKKIDKKATPPEIALGHLVKLDSFASEIGEFSKLIKNPNTTLRDFVSALAQYLACNQYLQSFPSLFLSFR